MSVHDFGVWRNGASSSLRGGPPRRRGRPSRREVTAAVNAFAPLKCNHDVEAHSQKVKILVFTDSRGERLNVETLTGTSSQLETMLQIRCTNLITSGIQGEYTLEDLV